MIPAALEGIKVLDLTQYFPGPFASQLLGDMGADVIKVEPPGFGDPMRSMGPYAGGESAFFNNLNRNKRSLVLDLKKPSGLEAMHRLVRGADVLLESFRPGVMERLGLGYAALSEINPKLVFCSFNGYGSEGPLAMAAGHDLNYLSVSGLLGLNCDETGKPVIPRFQIADVAGGLQGCIGVLSAIISRGRTGKGQKVESALADATAPWLVYAWAHLQAGGEWAGYLSGEYPCYAVYMAKGGGYLALAALEEKFWSNFCRRLGKGEWIAAQFAKGEGRERIFSELKTLFLTRTRDEWVEFFSDCDACLTPVSRLDELPGSDHWISRGLVKRDCEGGASPGSLGFALRMEGTPLAFKAPPPKLGQHSVEVLGEAGYSLEEIERLRREGVLEG